MIAFFSSMFGYILNYIYSLVQNYGVSIILFSVLLKIVLLPISIKQQKTMKKTQEMQVKIKEIQNKYKGNQEKINQEMMALYKKENVSPISGCFSSIIQILLLLAMFYLVKSPLTYMKKVDSPIIDICFQQIKLEKGENSVNTAYPEISIIKYINNIKNDPNVENEKKSENQETETAGTLEKNNTIIKENMDKLYINMDFIGLDLSNIPKENYSDIKVFIIPILYVISSFISIKLTTSTQKDKKEDIIVLNDSDKKHEEEPDMTAQMNKSMSWMMPIMSVTISLIAPLGLALYWLLNNILMIVERVVINKVLSKKEEDKNV